MASLALWLSRHPHVARIVLSHQGQGADVSPALAALASSACSELRLTGVRLRGACLPPMAHLRSLVLRNVSASGLSWRALAALPALEALELHWCAGGRGRGWRWGEVGQPLGPSAARGQRPPEA